MPAQHHHRTRRAPRRSTRRSARFTAGALAAALLVAGQLAQGATPALAASGSDPLPLPNVLRGPSASPSPSAAASPSAKPSSTGSSAGSSSGSSSGSSGSLGGAVSGLVGGSSGSTSGSSSSGSPTAAPTSPAVSGLAAATEGEQVDNAVANPAVIAYAGGDAAAPYAADGALVVAGRTNVGDPEMKRVAAAGGTVLAYVDAIIDNPWGSYHRMLMQTSICGPAVPRWPGEPRANGWGHLNDFRPGSVLGTKLECVLETIVRDNPHVAGFFADDLGSRSYFPGFSWEDFGSSNQAAYRAGAIELSKVFRRVADRHGLIVMVNGTWGAGSLASRGGGYPDMNSNGSSLADGTLAEHHSADGFWGHSYPCSSQWAAASPVTKGKAFHFAVTDTEAERDEFARTGCYAFAAAQSTYDEADVWGPFTRTGLPSGRRY